MRILETIGNTLGWEVGALWTPTPDAQALRCLKVWHNSWVKAEAFESACLQIDFTPGIGLPGRVWTSLKPSWIPDVSKDGNFPRSHSAAKAGLHGAFAFPIFFGESFLGVMEFFSHEIREPDALLLAMFGSIGGQIGQFTERKRVEEISQRLAAIVASSGDAILGIDLGGVVTSWNAAAEKLYGYTAAEIIGHNISMLIPADNAREEFEILGKLRRDETIDHYETVRVAKDGRSIHVSLTVSPIRDADGNLSGASKIARDISKRRRDEEALRESENRFRSVAETASDAIITIDEESNIVFVNPAAVTTFGYTEEELIGSKLTMLMPDSFSAAHKTGLDRYKQTGVERLSWTGMELQGRHKNGREISLEVSVGQLRKNGRLFFTGIVRDVTERKKAEAELQAWQRELESRVESRTAELALAHSHLQDEIEERKRLEAEIARTIEREQLRLGQELHDGLGQHLAGLGLMLAALQAKSEKESPKIAQHVQVLQQMTVQSVEQARNLAKSFYPVELERHGLLVALKEDAYKTERLFGISCLVQSDSSGCAELKGPLAIQLFRIAQEAVHNSVKYARAKQIRIGLFAVDGHIQLTVKDDGIGFPSMATESKGMGLRIMKYRARMVGGQVDFGNDPGGGAIITCSVPNRAAVAPVDPGAGVVAA
jgi:PAS domain S-box-containing protein